MDSYKSRQYKQIEESCYRMGIPVDLYYKIIIKCRELKIPEREEMSILEKEINDTWWD